MKQFDNRGQKITGIQNQAGRDINNFKGTQSPVDSTSQLEERGEEASIIHPPSTKQHIILLVHGIRTHGHWQEMVANCLEEPDFITVYPIRYGYLDVFKFWCPFFTRKRAVQLVLREIRLARKLHSDAHLSIIAHSFGTYAVGKILQDNPDIDIYRLIFVDQCSTPIFVGINFTSSFNQG